MRTILILAACLIASVCPVHAGDSSHPGPLRAIATSDSTEVHPDSVFDVTLSLQNLTGTTQTLTIPECGWDRLWKSSDGRVTWDFWDCDDKSKITITIGPHETYVFPSPLKMFVNSGFKKSHIKFKMGFKTATFGKVLWSDPIGIDVFP